MVLVNKYLTMNKILCSLSLLFYLFIGVAEESLGQSSVSIFRQDGTWTAPNNFSPETTRLKVDILVVAGGGGGGIGESAGGGGGGGLILIEDFEVKPGETYPIRVGRGGLGATASNPNSSNGGNSNFGPLEAIGGGGGGSSSNNDFKEGKPGGSGGGGAFFNGVGNGGNRENPSGLVSKRGFNGASGGANNNNNRRGGGGGGANSVGTSGNGANGGDGGDGLLSNISGEFVIYAAGGGGTSSSNRNNFGKGGNSGNAGGDANNEGKGVSGKTIGSGGGAGSTGGGNGQDGIVVLRIIFIPLPVEFAFFTGSFRRQERTVDLRWATAKEWENSHFEVQRSLDAGKSWEVLQEVQGQGYSDKPVDYKFTDENPPLAGGNVIYRLKQVDFDGTFAYSRVISVRVPGLDLTKGVWRAFPNPTTGERFNLELANSSEYQGEEIEVRLVSPGFGTQVFAGRSMREVSSSIEQQLQKFSKGVYILEVQWGQKVEFIKVLKQ